MCDNKFYIPHKNTGPQHQAVDDTATSQPITGLTHNYELVQPRSANTHHSLTCLSVPSFHKHNIAVRNKLIHHIPIYTVSHNTAL